MIKNTINNQGLNQACREQHEAILRKGFESTRKDLPKLLMLTVSELSEALEADRRGKTADIEAFRNELPTVYVIKDRAYGLSENKTPEEISEMFMAAFEKYIKDTLEDEIADAFLRLMDICGMLGIDIEAHILMKSQYNKLRPYKHGKAY